MQAPIEYDGGSESGQYSAESPGASSKGRKQSQRPTLACSECTRRSKSQLRYTLFVQVWADDCLLYVM